ncbi:xanthine phosphoribosyltransferase [Thermogymnomonas acidicola]|uniref:Xanthine phosphoribosyltransferase n=1 Tax=Thermogymnomonas acidicola TaxID=399579 RepID=A0AA37BQG2_9ARCH|nr:phosphoribosyltransferase [Thermogymnomonas acidicola]GGM69756.1 xanthine phosphoribosyltransferase [Thermogymnomonas acidicola]
MRFKATLVSWQDIEDWCDAIREKIVGDYEPNVIIGLSRGGLVPARILSDKLWVKELISVKTEHWGITATKDGKAVLKTYGKPDLTGKRVLVVDDITDTGESMRLAYDFVKSLNPLSVRTATMLHVSRSSFVPDYYARYVDEKNWAWFIFPWNVYEDLDNLIGRSMSEPMETTEIREILLRDYGLDVSSLDMEKILRDFENMGRIRRNGEVWVR